MSSSYKGHWINGSKETGYTAQPHEGEPLPETRPTIAAIKRYIDGHVPMKKGAHKMNAVADKAEYAANMDQMVQLGRKTFKVICYTRDGRSGSYERGFKFSSTKYGGLLDVKAKLVSFDHGKTWWRDCGGYYYDAWKATPQKDRIRLASASKKEFAFDSIQELNRQYFGPSYKWKP